MLRNGDAAALENLKKALEPYQTVVIWNVASVLRTTVPVPMQAFADHCLQMQPQFRYYWWRAVSVAYLIRPNERTLRWLEEQRALAFPGRFEFAANPRQQATVAMYIRHGDKGSEMKLVHPDVYLQTAVSLFDRGMVGAAGGTTASGENTTAPERVIFYGTETPDVLEYIVDWSAKNPTYTMLRTTLVDIVYDVSHTQPWEYPSMLLNLDISLRADAWVMTLGSNWCRIIDELRATIAGKQDLPFADLSVKTCPHPPCIGSGITDFDWRQ